MLSMAVDYYCFRERNNKTTQIRGVEYLSLMLSIITTENQDLGSKICPEQLKSHTYHESYSTETFTALQ